LKLKDIVIKQITGTITDEEIVELQELLKNPNNQKELELILRDYHDINISMSNNNMENAYDNIAKKIEALEKPKQTLVRKLNYTWYKYAAIILVFLGLTWFFKDSLRFDQDNTLSTVNEYITLQLDNGEIKTIDITKSQEVKNSAGEILGFQDANGLNYSSKTADGTLAFNTLHIPNGKQFKLSLSDGTIVHLNSGSTLKYPAFFSETGKREVFLKGEAFLDVSHNKDKPFILHSSDLDVEVLGTTFNVEAYEDDSLSEVVLVEGSVSLNAKNGDVSKIKLTPNQKGSLLKNDETIRVDEVDTYLYTSWIEGKLVFRNLKFNTILKKLERHFNVKIENSDKELGNELFNASFEEKNIDDILSYFKATHDINYSIKNNSVLIY
jgi:hypothetical protein